MNLPSQSQHPARKKPIQERGQQKYELLLAATAALLEEQGYEAVTTKAIAARADSAIGSFYQFFSNKEAAVNALVQRYRSRIRDFLAQSVAKSAGAGLNSADVENMIVGLAEIYRDLPGFRGIWAGNFDDGPLKSQAERLQREVFDALNAALRAAFPDVSTEDRERCLATALETAKHLLANAEDPEQTLTEMRRMLGFYIASYFG
jgi:AcrR family transcriptional regulator